MVQPVQQLKTQLNDVTFLITSTTALKFFAQASSHHVLGFL